MGLRPLRPRLAMEAARALLCAPHAPTGCTFCMAGRRAGACGRARTPKDAKLTCAVPTGFGLKKRLGGWGSTREAM